MEEMSNKRSQLYCQLLTFYNQISDELMIKYQTDSCKNDFSVQNLHSYLTLRKAINKAISDSLIHEGLSSFNDITPHILYSLKKMLGNLSGEHFAFDDGNFISCDDAIKVKKDRVLKLLGDNLEEKRPTIMVTLDKGMLEDTRIISDLLRSGMNLARINCAHDTPETWIKMVEEVRRAENKLMEDAPRDKLCKIYMDLPGPKIRIGKYKKEYKPIQLRVSKEKSTDTDKSLIGYLTSRQCASISSESTFVLSLTNCNEFIKTLPDSHIHFTDINGKKRTFTILEMVSNTCIKVRLNQNAVVDENTVLHYKDQSWNIHSLNERTVKIEVTKEDILRIYYNPDYLGRPKTKTEPASVSITYPKALKNLKIGDNVFLDDGKVHAKIVSIEEDFIELTIIETVNEVVKLKEGKGINFPDSLVHLNVPSITEDDLNILPIACEVADIIGLSFVHHPNDLIRLKELLGSVTKRKIGVVAKIETKAAVFHLSKLIAEGLNSFQSFGIMIARGDLAVEIGYKELSKVQEEILSICEASHTPVIWATGVLENLTKKGIPSKTELTDVYAGLRADCIMLNKGAHILEAVKMINDIHDRMQLIQPYLRIGSPPYLVQYGY